MMILLIILLLLGSTSLSNVVSVNERLAYRHNNDLILVYKNIINVQYTFMRIT